MFRTVEEFKDAYINIISSTYAKPLENCTEFEKMENLAHLMRTICSGISTDTRQIQKEKQMKKVYYFSMEFLMGRLLDNCIINLGIRDIVVQGMAELGIDYEKLCEFEPDPALGNGGLGRLAACFLDSMAATGVAGIGMGLRYKFGLFKQEISNGYQIEKPDSWLEDGDPWEWSKPGEAIAVRFGGRVERRYSSGQMSFEHKDYTVVNAVPYDIPIVGWNGDMVNALHLWSAEPAHASINMEAFNKGDYALALKERSEIEAITCILYPDDSNGMGRKLRLKQEYFLVAAGIGHIVRGYIRDYGLDAWDKFPDRIAIHINDTHPALCVPELLRVLIDEQGLDWDCAWDITTRTISFTNHTVLPEALEKWFIPELQPLLPRVYMIIEEIDRRFKESIDKNASLSNEILKKTAVLWDTEIRMANLSIIGSHSVNGVAALHTDILKKDVFSNFYKLFPERFNNKTNGVSQRRFLVESNRPLTGLITEAIGEGWIEDMSRLKSLMDFRDDAAFLEKLAAVKRQNKLRLADYISRYMDIDVNPDSVFDIQVKRFHAYKRQLLNALKILDLYNKLKENPDLPIQDTTFIFAGKAAQGYAYAKEIIKFINSIADLVNADPVVSKRIKVIFMENFRVSNAQLIYPAADISEQISTAGKEASGTGNMKFMMNGAITLGTLDGANIEILEQVGAENMKIFGLTSEDTHRYRTFGGYSTADILAGNPALSRMMEQLIDDTFMGSGQNFWNIFDALTRAGDEYFVLGDFDSYAAAWQELSSGYKNRSDWNKMSLANIANSGFFSSDRTIREYADQIWHAGHH